MRTAMRSSLVWVALVLGLADADDEPRTGRGRILGGGHRHRLERVEIGLDVALPLGELVRRQEAIDEVDGSAGSDVDRRPAVGEATLTRQLEGGVVGQAG